MKLAAFEVLSADEIRQIHQATVAILRDVGVRIGNPRMLERLAARGLPVERTLAIVRIPQACLEDALATVPRQFEMFNRDGAPAFLLGDGTPRIAAGHNAVFWVDSETGETRSSRVADVELFARICEVLPAIDMIGIPVMPQDVPEPRATLLYGVRAVIANSRKPIFFSTDNYEVNRAVIDMCAAAFAGELATQPYGISQLSPPVRSPGSPGCWMPSPTPSNGACRWPCSRSRTPASPAPIPSPGCSPCIMSSRLSGIVMAQLLRPGAKVLYASSWTTTDMRSGAALVGSTETSLCHIAGTQLSRFYHIPHHTTAPNSDNHAHDEQNAWGKTLSTFCAVGAGTDLLVNCGMFATGMTCSHEQLLMDEEISALRCALPPASRSMRAPSRRS